MTEQSRVDFFSRIDAVSQVLKDPISVDSYLANDPRIIASKMIRSSLTVSTFSFLESYLEDRVIEIMPMISKSRIPYNSFPDNFKKLVTVKALQGCANRAKFERVNPIGFVEQNLIILANFANKRPDYSHLGFSSVGSNIAEGHIGEFISDLGLSGWKTLADALTKISYNSPDFLQEFKSLSEARNSSAHDPVFNVPSTDLEGYRNSAIRIGVSFDLVLTFLSQCYRKGSSIGQLNLALSRGIPDVAVIEQLRTGGWGVTYGPTMIGSYATQQKAEVAARRISFLTVVRDRSLIPFKVL